VFITSRAGQKHRDRAAQIGASDYVVKPFQSDVLLERVDSLIRAARAVA
jgi:DNA-binding response OmpR family regulator